MQYAALITRLKSQSMQITNTVLMIRPVQFRKNEETAVNNYFQEDLILQHSAINKQAQMEFDLLVERLREVGVSVIVVDDLPENDTPDSIFPNNWISFHDNGTVALYPMFAENRRRERREDILDILEQRGFEIREVMDYSGAEAEGLYLEGTGSILLDRVHRKAYCALSDRADESLFIEFCEDFEFDPVVFNAFQQVNNQRLPIYHTNVMMCLGETFAVICLDSIDDKKERKSVLHHLRESGKEVVEISEEQIHHFAGNMLQLLGKDNQRILVMSESAFKSLNSKQIATLQQTSRIVYSSLHTIESCGGGSARCMLAEVFLPRSVAAS